MLRNLCLTLLALLPIACANNKEIVSYTVDGKVKSVKGKAVIEELKSLFDKVSPQEMGFMLSAPDTFQMVVQNRVFEADLLADKVRQETNFTMDPTYVQNVTYQSNALPFEFAFKKGIEEISNTVEGQKVALAEVFRIMFTNDVLTDNKTPAEVLEEIKAVEDISERFVRFAGKYSHEQLGAQNGGYLGYIVEGQFPALDNVVFAEVHTGLYPELITDQYGTYIVYVRTPVKEVKIADFAEESIMVSKEQLMKNYLDENVEILFTKNGENILIDGKQKQVSDIKADDVLLKMWGKPYSYKKIKEEVQILLGRSDENSLSANELLSLLELDEKGSISLPVEQLAVIAKGYNKNITKSKEYKETLAKNVESIEMEVVYNFISRQLFQSFNTNVTDRELTEFYADKNNRQIVSYDEDGTPKYASLAVSKEEIKQKILATRVEEIRLAFQAELDKSYDIIWNEENLFELMGEVQELYDEYLEENDLLQEENLFDASSIEQMVEEEIIEE